MPPAASSSAGVDVTVPPQARPTNASCDRCRSRKVKCIPLTQDELVTARELGVADRCKGCYRVDKACTRDYVHKKPGRPLGSRTRSRRATPGSGPNEHDPLPQGQGTLPPSATDPVALLAEDGAGPAFGSIFGSARSVALMNPACTAVPQAGYNPPGAFPLFDPPADGDTDGVGSMVALGGLGPLQLVTEVLNGDATVAVPVGNSAPRTASNGNGNGDVRGPTPLSDLWPRDTSHVSPPLIDPSASIGGTVSPTVDPDLGNNKGYEDGHDLDAVLPWGDVCFFVSLFFKDQHCIMPIVHKPTFSQDVLARRDRHDEAFRGLVCSLVAFTISQCPISRMTGRYERPRLATLLRRCTRAAESIRVRQRMQPGLMLLASTILDWITAQAIGNLRVCDMFAAEATRLVHALGLADARPPLATDTVETQLCYRLFWVVYLKDKTEALSGRPISLHDFEGVPPVPLAVDDDYITRAGHLPQPADIPSYMFGFETIVRIFQVISQCVARHRAYANLCAEPMTEADKDHAPILRWISSAQARLRDITEHLPDTLLCTLADLARAGEGARGDLGLLGIQQSNIHVTVLCAEFALLDFRAALCPLEDSRCAREAMARKAYDTLSSIPYEYLASNGESMRGKVLRIILALLSMTTEPVNFSQDVWDWWNMYSRVQFLQVIPDKSMVLIDESQEAQPAAEVSAAGARLAAGKSPQSVITSAQQSLV